MPLTRRSAAGALAIAIAGPLLMRSALAQQFQPTKSVRIIVPYTPGGVPDLMARQIAKELGAMWKQSVIVENRAGASGAIGIEMLAKSPGDGHSFLIADDGALISAPLLKAKLSYDPVTDIVPLGSVGASPYVIVGPPDSPSIQQLFTRAKSNPGSVDYATNGIGGPHHQIWERWQEQLGLKLNQIAYSGTLPALQDVAAGRIALMACTPSSALALLQGGRIKPLAAVSKTRFPFMPNVPATAELGYPTMEAVAWYCFMAPGSMPDGLKEKVGADLRAVLASKDYITSVEERHNVSLVLTGKEASERMARERAQAKALFKRIGIEPA